MGTLETGSGPDSLAARVEEIVRAAEREAEALQRELGGAARASDGQATIAAGPVAPDPHAAAAERRLDDLHVVVDDLVLRAEAARAALVELEAAIVAARAALPVFSRTPPPVAASAAAGVAPSRAVPADPPPPPAAAEPEPVVARPYSAQGMDEPDVVGARLVAMEMAFAGRPRKEVDRHLREEFRITETGTLLNDVFGAGRETWGS
jgi:hypothetical protein